MNVEKICSPYTDLSILSDALDRSHPEFRRGVYDMCAAFNFKADCPSKSAQPDDVVFMTPNGWSAGRLIYIGTDRTGDAPFFRYTSRAINKKKADSRSDRNARAANKIRDLIKTLRMKDEVITDENVFTHEHRGVRYAFEAVLNSAHDQTLPALKLESAHLVAEVMGAAFGTAELGVAARAELDQIYKAYKEKVAKREESHASVAQFRKSIAVGICNYWGDTHYFVGKVNFVKETGGSYEKVELQAPMKRYTTLADTEIATDAAIIRTYMQGHRHYESANELGLPRGDRYYDEIGVATGYATDTMLWVLMPERGE